MDRADPTNGSSARLLTQQAVDHRFLRVLTAAITCRTVSYDDGRYEAEAFDALAQLLEGNYPLLHRQLEVEEFGTHSRLYTWAGSDPAAAPIVLMAHQDVVPVEDGTEDAWQAPPFAATVVSGRLYGRGAIDCKGPLVAIMEAIERSLEGGVHPVRSILFVCGHDEEVGGERGAGAIADAMRTRGIRPWFVLDEGGAVVEGGLPGLEAPVALVAIAEKGRMNVHLTAHATGGHASLPSPDAAIPKLARALRRLETRPLPAQREPIRPLLAALRGHLPGVFGAVASLPYVGHRLASRLFRRRPRLDALQRTTLVPTVLRGGEKSNVMPQSATAVLNVRVIPGDTAASVLRHIRRVAGGDIEVVVPAGPRTEPSRFSSTRSDAWAFLSDAVSGVYPGAVVAPYVLPGRSDSRFFDDFAGDVYRFSPFVLDPAALAAIHSSNESMRVEDGERAVAFFMRLIGNLGDEARD